MFHISTVIAKMTHEHDFGEWIETNKHYWSHAKTLYRTCKTCYKDEYRLIELNCPQYKIKGEYCYWCERYEKEWQKRLDGMTFPEYHVGMNKKKTTKGPIPKFVRNIAITIEHELHAETFRALGTKYKLKNPKTVMMICRRSEKYLNMEAIREVVGKKP